MSQPVSRLLAPVLVLLLGACLPALAATPVPDADGLVRQSARGFETFSRRPGEGLSAYRKLLLPAVEVSFKAGWDDQHRNVKPEEARALQADFARLATEAFRRVLTRGGRFEVVEAAGPGVLELRVKLLDFDLYAPEVNDASVRRSYVFTAGEGTLVVELRDAQAGTLWARARDHREMRRYEQLQIANSITNSSEARDLLEDWARSLRRQLDTVTQDHKGS